MILSGTHCTLRRCFHFQTYSDDALTGDKLGRGLHIGLKEEYTSVKYVTCVIVGIPTPTMYFY